MKENQSTFPQVFTILTAMALLLTACGEKPQQPPVPQTAPAPTKLFQEQRSALDKAKGVEQTIEKGSEESKQEMERQAQ